MKILRAVAALAWLLALPAGAADEPKLPLPFETYRGQPPERVVGSSRVVEARSRFVLGPVLQAEEMATVEGKGAGARASNSSAALPARGATSRAQAGTGAAAASLLASPSAAPSGDAACLPCGPILTPILVAAGTTRRSKPCALVDRAHMCMRARMRAQNAAPRGIRGCAPFMDALHAFARHR